MDYLVRAAPTGVEALWFISGDLLIIEVSDKLDRFAQQRWIDQALREHDIEPRRHIAVPLIVGAGAGAHRAVRQHAVATAIISGAVATGVAAAMVLPTLLDESQHTINRRHGTPPAAVQSTPPRSGPTKPQTPPTAQPVSGTTPASPAASPSTPLLRTPTHLPISPPAAPGLHGVPHLRPVTGPLPTPPPLPLPLPRPLPLPHPQQTCLLNLSPLLPVRVLCGSR